MVVMYVDCCVCGVEYFPYYSYSRNSTGREFFVPSRTLIEVKLLITYHSRLNHGGLSYHWDGGTDKASLNGDEKKGQRFARHFTVMSSVLNLSLNNSHNQQFVAPAKKKKIDPGTTITMVSAN